MFGLSAFSCRKRATLSPVLFSRFQLEKRPNPRSNSISFSNATSVPGSRHTATFGSPTAAKPRVIEWLNCVVTSLSPTFAGRDATCADCSRTSTKLPVWERRDWLSFSEKRLKRQWQSCVYPVIRDRQKNLARPLVLRLEALNVPHGGGGHSRPASQKSKNN